MTATFDKLYAILRRDLLTTIRHRSGFVLSLVGTFTELAAFYFLSRAIGSGFRPDGVAFFPFLLVGTGVYTFFVMSVQAFVSAVQEAQQTGTLEVLMTSSTGPVELLILSSISAFAGTLGNLLPRRCLSFGHRRSNAPDRVPERFRPALVAWLRNLVPERNHVSRPQPTSSPGTSRARHAFHICHRWHAPSPARWTADQRDGPYLGHPRRFWPGPAPSCNSLSVVHSPPRPAKWNPFILLSMLIRSCGLRLRDTGTRLCPVVHCLYSYQNWEMSQLRSSTDLTNYERPSGSSRESAAVERRR